MRLLLFFPKWTNQYDTTNSYFAKRSSTLPPMNLTYIAAISEQRGDIVKIIDCELEDISSDKFLSYIEKFKPNIIGTTSTTPTFDITLKYTKDIKKAYPKIPIVLGGNHISILGKDGFDKSIDYGIIGEGDYTWKEFLDAYESKIDLSNIRGLLYRKKGKVIFTGYRDIITDLDSLPLPARHLLEMTKYYYGTMKGRRRVTSIMATRGCPYHCIFCSTKVFGNSVRKRSPQKVIEEMKNCINNYGTEHFYFNDDTVTLDKKYILELCDLMIKEKLNITWESSTRANRVDDEIISTLAKSGCVRLSFGLESVNENIRKIMRKEVPLEDYIKANKLTNKYNIETINSCMIGLPGENIDTIRELLRFLRKSKEIKQANIAIAIPYPGTQLYDMAKKGEHNLKLMTEDFSQYRRYGSAVMTVGDLTPNDLISLQNDAIASLYMAPWRMIPVLKKQGIKGLFLTYMRIVKNVKKIVKNENGLFWFK